MHSHPTARRAMLLVIALCTWPCLVLSVSPPAPIADSRFYQEHLSHIRTNQPIPSLSNSLQIRGGGRGSSSTADRRNRASSNADNGQDADPIASLARQLSSSVGQQASRVGTALQESAQTFKKSLQQSDDDAVDDSRSSDSSDSPAADGASIRAGHKSRMPPRGMWGLSHGSKHHAAPSNGRMGLKRHHISPVVPFLGMQWIRVALSIRIFMEVLDYCGWIDQDAPNKLKQNVISVWGRTKPKVERWQTRVHNWWDEGQQMHVLWHPSTWSSRQRFLQALHQLPSKRQFTVGAWIGVLATSSVMCIAASSTLTAALLTRCLQPLASACLGPAAATYACSEINFSYKRKRRGWNLKEITGGDDTMGDAIDKGLESVRIRVRKFLRRTNAFFTSNFVESKIAYEAPKSEDALLDDEINNVLRSSGGSSSYYFGRMRQQFIELQQGIKELKEELGVRTMSSMTGESSGTSSGRAALGPKLALPVSIKKGLAVGISSTLFLFHANSDTG